jgi:hypothetical protein
VKFFDVSQTLAVVGPARSAQGVVVGTLQHD